MDKVVILTGGTSGIGGATVKQLRAAGCRVYEFSRRGAPNDPFHTSVDVTDGACVRAAVDAVIAKEGRVDVLINNAGFGISGAMEFTDPADAHRQMEVNLFGM
ncbi:MAG: SDR family NAD(P)-dependent oxidoreductase, partial [Clostridia bacterium]|nr:SDR family NAD(P)-dependent oxidoreductase [Clostridia bacterium]